MAFQYPFTKTVTKADAFDAYLKQYISWLSDYQGASTTDVQVIIFVDRQLTTQEQTDLQTLIDNYTDPAVWLTFDHVETMALHSHFTDDVDNLIIDGQDVLQTYIFCNRNTPQTVLDSMKTIVEYKCADVSAFANNTTGNITLSLYDISRDVEILSGNIELAEIGTRWNTLAQQGNVTSDTVFRSVQFYGLMNTVPNYDCVWQIRGSTEPPGTFTYRINGLQYIFYNVE
jgi:hypothetical protein